MCLGGCFIEIRLFSLISGRILGVYDFTRDERWIFLWVGNDLNVPVLWMCFIFLRINISSKTNNSFYVLHDLSVR